MAKGCLIYTPQFVVDWLYQCVLDAVRVLEVILGVVSYSAEGYPLGDGVGQVMLFWGSHVGSIREQALIVWDYDVDLAVFYHEDDFALIWNSAKRQLQHLGYVCTQHSAHKYRVAPKPCHMAPLPGALSGNTGEETESEPRGVEPTSSQPLAARSSGSAASRVELHRH